MRDRTTIRAVVGNDHTEIYSLPEDIIVESDVMIPTGFGPRLAANIFRPPGEGPWPVIMCCTAYGKDLHPLDYTLRGRGPANRSIGLDMGDMRVSDHTPFEAADPGFWVPEGFVVVHVDALGSGKSEGDPALGLGDVVVGAFADAVTWASAQPWSNGRVGLSGVSYLAAVQWRIAQTKPSGLAAICPWEGFTDVFSDVAVHGGIPETSFLPWWLSGEKSASPEDDGGPFFHATKPDVAGEGIVRALSGLTLGVCPDRADFPVPDIDYGAINCAVLVCGSWSAQGLHSRGAFRGFEEVASSDKFLFTHGRHEWTVSNSTEALRHQLMFFRRFLADDHSAVIPRVRLEVRSALESFEVRGEESFPPSEAEIVALYLDASSGSLTREAPAPGASLSYDSTSATGGARFEAVFDSDVEISGPIGLRVWMATDAGVDLDLFVGIRKLDVRGVDVEFWNRLSRHDIATRGWLRASRRPDPSLVVDPLRPRPTFDSETEVVPGQMMELWVEILPSATLFEAGTSLVLELRGRDVVELANFQHHQIMNTGNHTVFTGGHTPSQLIVPMVRRP